ncbi:sulfurtransferase TusA family protein [uncultured Pelagimonas sp.]|uniref:sulfurtransferase TusA family protein n=1 Tax=uncultured Pelagimonas sp. TaxID=1618102 RepID=UPI00260B79E8|nr:sulfurtransferase TusA family protein [uncultured Pelagimonas sp.]
MTHELDAIGLLCPLPVLKARKRMQALAVGETLVVHTDDPAAVIDMPHYCNESGHELVDQAQNGDVMVWTLRKA